jgi:hypothetical protein
MHSHYQAFFKCGARKRGSDTRARAVVKHAEDAALRSGDAVKEGRSNRNKENRNAQRRVAFGKVSITFFLALTTAQANFSRNKS